MIYLSDNQLMLPGFSTGILHTGLTARDIERKFLKYRCSVCYKICRDNRTLEMHMHTHTGAKLYACKHCGAKFSQPSSLNRHVKNSHIKRSCEMLPQ